MRFATSEPTKTPSSVSLLLGLPSALSLDEEWDGKKAQIGDWSEVLRQLRNLIHPARYVLDLPHKRVTKRHLEMSFETFGVVTEYLLNKIGEPLRAAFEADDEEEDATKNPESTI